MRLSTDLGHPVRILLCAAVIGGSGLAILEACSSDSCSDTATCAGGTSGGRADGSTSPNDSAADSSNPSDGAVAALSVQLTGPSATTIAVQGAKAEVAIGIVRGAGVGAFTITASGLPAGMTIAPVDVAADATTATVVIDVPSTQPQGPLDGIKVAAVVDDASPSLGDLALPVFVRGASGSLDTTFGRVTGTLATGNFVHATAQSDGKIVAAFPGVDFDGGGVVRFLPDGGIDSAFGDAGTALTPGDQPARVLIDANGRVVIVIATGVAVTTTNGSLDPTYGTGGVSHQYAAQIGEVAADGAFGPAGTFFVAALVGGAPGNYNETTIQRLTALGDSDDSYPRKVVRSRANGAPTWLAGSAVASAPDGTTYVGYGVKAADSTPQGAVTKVTSTGEVGTPVTFTCGAAGGAAIDRASNGNVVVVSGSYTYSQFTCVRRFTSTLDVDTTLAGTGGVAAFPGLNAFPTSVRTLADGSILVAGIAQAAANQHDEVVLQRFLNDGTSDPSYGTGGILHVSAEGDATQASMAGAFIQADGSVIAVGSTTNNQGQTRIFRLWQ